MSEGKRSTAGDGCTNDINNNRGFVCKECKKKEKEEINKLALSQDILRIYNEAQRNKCSRRYVNERIEEKLIEYMKGASDKSIRELLKVVYSGNFDAFFCYNNRGSHYYEDANLEEPYKKNVRADGSN